MYRSFLFITTDVDFDELLQSCQMTLKPAMVYSPEDHHNDKRLFTNVCSHGFIENGDYQYI